MIGRYPTPVEQLAALSTERTTLWVKRDDRTGDVYGGNKVRRLEHILADARAKGARRILTVGAAGSHHVLATTIYARRAGFEVAAALTPQPRTAHAVDTLRAGLALGLQTFPAASIATAPFAFLRAHRRGDFVVAPGGSSVSGTIGYVDAALELADQIRAKALPCPDAIVVALGSGGTAAGLLAGVASAGLATRVIGVRIVGPLLMGRERLLSLAMRAGTRRGVSPKRAALAAAFDLEPRFLGRGYGYSTEEGGAAIRAAATEGLTLDPTYTAKAFAAVLELVKAGTYRNLLYWHTLSSAPMAPLLESACDLPSDLDRLFFDP